MRARTVQTDCRKFSSTARRGKSKLVFADVQSVLAAHFLQNALQRYSKNAHFKHICALNFE